MRNRVFVVISLAAALFSVSASGACLSEMTGVFESQNGGCRDMATGLTWSQSAYLAYYQFVGYYPNQSQAINYCRNLTESGVTWRPATYQELQRLAQDGGSNFIEMLAPNTTFRWSGSTKGNKGYAVQIHTDGTYGTWLTLATSQFDTICVR